MIRKREGKSARSLMKISARIAFFARVRAAAKNNFSLRD